MTEYWLISAPAEPNSAENWKILSKAIQKLKNCEAYKFYVPPLRVGTLDTLLTDSDDLVKLEFLLEGQISRLLSSLEAILEGEKLRKESFSVDNTTVHEYLISFKWDVTKFPPKQTIKSLALLTQKQALHIDNEYKIRFQEYMFVKGTFENMEKNDRGNLLTRNLNELVTENDFVLNSEFLCTVLVVVNKKLYSDWLRTYEHFDKTVIPKSSRVITEDHEFYLIGVTLFRERVKQFTDLARKFKFTVRDFVYDENAKSLYKENFKKIHQKKELLFSPLVHGLKNYFSEVFKSFVHIKACRLFVESVLRYGLPANFGAAVIVVNKKYIKKLKEILYHQYKHLDMTSGEMEKPTNMEAITSLGPQAQEYYPYVCFKINVDFSRI
uniref:V-type proton ATPase subunit C n=1 Tax=Rhodnius prolixus TaxID=13249 RepID=T1HBF3_RHOPR